MYLLGNNFQESLYAFFGVMWGGVEWLKTPTNSLSNSYFFFLEEGAIKSPTKTSANPEIVLEKEAEENDVPFTELENGNFI